MCCRASCVAASLGVVGTYQRGGVGLGTVLQQHIDDVRVSLLCCLV